MRQRIILLLVLYLSPSLRAQVQTCKLANEEFKECGSACPPTCATPAPEMCVDMCVSGCFCATGYLRAADGSCVEESICKTIVDCPPGVEKAYCLVDPCAAANCANFPDAKCTANYCGGCKAIFTDSTGQEVTCDATDPSTGCPPGIPQVRCFADPCAVSNCPAFPNAKCTANYCGGCNAVYTNDIGQVVQCQQISGSDCKIDGKTYKAGESWQPDPCTTCECDASGRSLCAVRDCAAPPCANARVLPGQCCPTCPNTTTCGANEVYSECGSACPPTCGQAADVNCVSMCVSGCFCKPGLFRTADGKCVEQLDCPVPIGKTDEHGCVPSAGFSWCAAKSKCLRAWEEECPDVSILPVDEVDANGCLLGAGYVWCEATAKCIRPWEEKCTLAFGGAADEHGCIGSAGYKWCEAKQKCHRPWEENCDAAIGPNLGGNACRSHAGYLWCEAKQKCLRPWEERCTSLPTRHARRDSQGCIVTAGYLWCEAKRKCTRVWEEPCELPPTQAEPSIPHILGSVVSTLANSHGCLGHAGFTWCEAKQKCLRLWEEPCEKDSTSSSPQACLGSAGYVWCESSSKCLRAWEEKCDSLMGVIQDSNGCRPSVGMMYCEAKKKCLRPWEEPCEAADAPTGPLGQDTDLNGCIGHAGYIYCKSKQKCLRPWEEECPLTIGGRDDNGCVGTAGFTWCQHKGKCVRPWEEECEVSAPKHNCYTREVWAQDKQDWCCKNRGIGCGDECPACSGPAPLGASKLCTDGSVAGPVCKRDAAGNCGWQLTTCPEPVGPQVCCMAMPVCPVGYAATDACQPNDPLCRTVSMCCTTISCRAIELPMGGNRDPSNPCSATGGYTWCETKKKCLRAWEEACDAPHAVDASTGITSATTDLGIMGTKKDENGCLTSGGQSWCQSKRKCLRVWEEECPLSDCSGAADWTRCDDGDATTVGDHCVAGKCIGRPVKQRGPSIRTVLQMELDQFDANDWLAKLTAHFQLPSADFIHIVSIRGGSVTVEHQFVVPATATAYAAVEPSALTTQYLTEAADPASPLSSSTQVKSAAASDPTILPATDPAGKGKASLVLLEAGGGIFVLVAFVVIGVVVARKRQQAQPTDGTNTEMLTNSEALL